MDIPKQISSIRRIFGNALHRLARWIHHAQAPQVSSSPTQDQRNHREELTNRLRGQSIVVPDISYLYSSWPVRLNPAVDECRKHLEVWFEQYIPTVSQRNKQRKVDNALCSGHFWTGVPTERFLVLGSLMAFFFFWDDEIDCGSLTNDRAKTEAYCTDTIAFLQCHLQPELKTPPPTPGRMHNAGTFVNIGEAIQTGQSREARNRFAESLYAFVRAVRDSQAQWLVGVTTLDDYIERRSQTVGTEPCVTILQWAYGLDLNSIFWNHEATKSIVREVAVSVCLYNDLASLKKEVADGDVDSAVPILVWNEGLTAQSAVDRIVRMIQASWDKLIEAETRLSNMLQSEPERHDMEVFVGGCKDIVVGHVCYALKAARYMADIKLNTRDNGFRVVL